MNTATSTISATAPSEEVPVDKGPSIGFFLGMAIHEWIRMPEGIYNFEGIALGPKPGIVDLTKLKPGEICVTPGLCYKMAPNQKLEAEK